MLQSKIQFIVKRSFLDVAEQNLVNQLQFINITTIQILKLIAHFYSIFT
jgi:hypothetical protein